MCERLIDDLIKLGIDNQMMFVINGNSSIDNLI